MVQETVTVRLESDEATDEIEVPETITKLLSEGDDTVTDVIGDLAMLGLAQQAHGIVHHSQGDVSEEIADAEELTMDLFEERFGQSYAEMTGHDH